MPKTILHFIDGEGCNSYIDAASVIEIRRMPPVKDEYYEIPSHTQVIYRSGLWNGLGFGGSSSASAAIICYDSEQAFADNVKRWHEAFGLEAAAT